ncbi:hypothetical protein [Microbacterium sp.]|uniref:hypothetical protein n=1 Tax=Microbacterium sp. TaxID=51671 RepID=UPI003F992B19
MSEPIYPEDALEQSDPNPEGEDVDPDDLSIAGSDMPYGDDDEESELDERA